MEKLKLQISWYSYYSISVLLAFISGATLLLCFSLFVPFVYFVVKKSPHSEPTQTLPQLRRLFPPHAPQPVAKLQPRPEQPAAHGPHRQF
jgi:hypothetical protein